MKKIVYLVLLLVFSAGCGTTAKFIYPSKSKNLVRLYYQPRYDVSLAVLPFEEMREDTNTSSISWIGILPLVPFGQSTYERPDGARNFNTIWEFDFDCTEDLAKAAATSMRRSGLFKDVFFTYGGEKSKADLVLKGEVLSTKFRGRTWTYGLSVASPVLWLLGLPYASIKEELVIKLSLENCHSNKKIWTYCFTKEDSFSQGCYYNNGDDIKPYTTLMEQGMNDAIKDLNRVLLENPKLLGEFQTAQPQEKPQSQPQPAKAK